MARQRGGGGRGGGGGAGRGRNPPKKRGSRRGGRPQGEKPATSYYMQPGKGGTVIILHRPVGNRLAPKVCGVMPSRNHAKALVEQLRRAESALHDLFYEATDDGIEALEAVLAACRDAVLTRSPPDVHGMTPDEMTAERNRLQDELDARAPEQRAVS
jgi:hypothetical protein